MCILRPFRTLLNNVLIDLGLQGHLGVIYNISLNVDIVPTWSSAEGLFSAQCCSCFNISYYFHITILILHSLVKKATAQFTCNTTVLFKYISIYITLYFQHEWYVTTHSWISLESIVSPGPHFIKRLSLILGSRLKSEVLVWAQFCPYNRNIMYWTGGLVPPVHYQI